MYNLKSTEFRDLPPGVRDKGRAEGLPNFRYRDNVAQDLCGCHLKRPWDLDFILEATSRGLVNCCSKLGCGYMDYSGFAPRNNGRNQLLKDRLKKEPIINNT